MFDWDNLAEKVKQWKKLFNDVKKIGDNKIAYVTKTITCYYKLDTSVYVPTQLKKFTVSNTLGDILLTLETIEGKEYIVCVSEAFEAKAFGKVKDIEEILSKILESFSCDETTNMERLASQEL